MTLPSERSAKASQLCLPLRGIGIRYILMLQFGKDGVEVFQELQEMRRCLRSSERELLFADDFPRRLTWGSSCRYPFVGTVENPVPGG
jgi:hypothetical protein